MTFTASDLSTEISIENAVGIKFNANINGDDGQVTQVTGDYSGITLLPPTYVDFNDFVFNPPIPPIPSTLLWSFSFGGSDYSFTMIDLTIVTQTTQTVSLEGTGFADTTGDFSITMNQSGEVTSFSSSASVVVPVPAAVWLFGPGLLGLVGVARRKAA